MPTDNTSNTTGARAGLPREIGRATGVEPSRTGGTDRLTTPAQRRQFETESSSGYPGLRNPRGGK